jgi:hypothetical protein
MDDEERLHWFTIALIVCLYRFQHLELIITKEEYHKAVKYIGGKPGGRGFGWVKQEDGKIFIRFTAPDNVN